MGIEVKGITLPAIKLKLDPNMSIEENFRELQAKLSTDFFKNSTTIVDYNGVKLSSAAKKLIEDKIAAHNAEIMGALSGWSNPNALPENKKLVIPIQSAPAPKSPPSNPIKADSVKHNLYIEAKTLRSGQRVEHEGDVLVLGNVNPDSYITAYGNIIIIGTLRGVVHAGYNGNESAVVIAMKMAPQQLRIANHNARPPDDMEIPDSPEMAYVENNQIYIEKI